jgi:hypothetical protein
MIKFNCIYQSLKKVSGEWHAGHYEWMYIWNYCQFFEDGRMAYYTFSSEDTDAIKKWFVSDDNNGVRGTYECENDNGRVIIGENESPLSIYNDRIIIHWNSGPEMYFPI